MSLWVKGVKDSKPWMSGKEKIKQYIGWQSGSKANTSGDPGKKANSLGAREPDETEYKLMIFKMLSFLCIGVEITQLY